MDLGALFAGLIWGVTRTVGLDCVLRVLSGYLHLAVTVRSHGKGGMEPCSHVSFRRFSALGLVLQSWPYRHMPPTTSRQKRRRAPHATARMAYPSTQKPFRSSGASSRAILSSNCTTTEVAIATTRSCRP